MINSGYVAEVFRSIQGEGLYVGVLQVFVRTSGCSCSCIYCDTPAARGRLPDCALRAPDSVRKVGNPVSVEELVSFVRVLIGISPGIHSLSVTGGEPLEQPDFLIDFLNRFRPLGIPIYLESNGLEEAAAGAVAPLVDIASIDIKLPSLCGGRDVFGTYGRVLPLFGGKDLFCKVVLARGFDAGEFLEAVRVVAGLDDRIPFIIQPARPIGSSGRVEAERLLECYFTASGHLVNVRLIPQCHPLIGVP